MCICLCVECVHMYVYKGSKIFVAASYQTGLDTRSKARRPIKYIKGVTVYEVFCISH